MTCRKHKVKCDESKPNCTRCVRLERICVWNDEVQVFPRRSSNSSSSTITDVVSTRSSRTPPASQSPPTIALRNPSGQNLIIEFPNLDRQTLPYVHHFITFCCRFIVYPNDDECNPFEQKLVPLASSSPALLHAMTAVSAGHLARGQKQHSLVAAHHYTLALRALNDTLSDPDVARSDSTLGACLLLCLYEVIPRLSFPCLH